MKWMLAVVLVISACAAKKEPGSGSGSGSGSDSKSPDAAVHAGRWIEDDYDKALAESRRRKLPLVVDMWATWCHTCLSMQNYVLTEEHMARYWDRFVWLELDTEKEQNASAMAKYGVDSRPTYYVIDPVDESVAGRWSGSASVAEFQRWLDEGERAVEMAHAGSLPPGSPKALLIAGHRAVAGKHYAEGAALFEQVLLAAPGEWHRRPETLVALVGALYKAKEWSRCVDHGLANLDRTGNSALATDFAYYVTACAGELPKGDARVEKARRGAEARMTAVASDPTAPLTADDRGDAWRNIWEVREQLGDEAGVKQAAEQVIAVLDAAAKGLPDDVATTYDWARAEAYVKVGRGEEAIVWLTAREKALPNDYNPAHFLARVYKLLKRPDEAIAALDRALAKAYGPRKAGMLQMKADLLESQGKTAETVAVVKEQLALYRALPEGQKLPEREQAAADRLAKLLEKTEKTEKNPQPVK